MEPKACRAYMRNKLADLNVSAEVTDIKPLRHDKYYLFKAVCLRCQERSSAVQYRGTYYRRDLGVIAKTFTITSQGAHQHAENEASDRCRVFNPIQEKRCEGLHEHQQPLVAESLAELSGDGRPRATDASTKCADEPLDQEPQAESHSGGSQRWAAPS